MVQYRTHEGLWSKQFIWSLEIENVSPSTWWNGICGSSKLSKIASAILSLPSSSAATDRSFSTYSLIHTKKRNKLTNERAGKLLYIHQNQNNLHKKQVQKKNSQNTEKNIQSDVSETHSIVNDFDMAPSTSTFNINQSSEKVEAEAEHEINIISSCSEEDWDTDDLVDNSMDTESFSSRSDFEEVINT